MTTQTSTPAIADLERRLHSQEETRADWIHRRDERARVHAADIAAWAATGGLWDMVIEDLLERYDELKGQHNPWGDQQILDALRDARAFRARSGAEPTEPLFISMANGQILNADIRIEELRAKIAAAGGGS